MTQDEQRIEELIAHPPVVKVTAFQKFLRVVAIVAFVVSLVSLAVGIGAFREIAAQGDCINTNLGIRQVVAVTVPANVKLGFPAATDTQAEHSYLIAQHRYDHALNAVVAVKRGQPGFTAAVHEFLAASRGKELADDILDRQRAANQAFRTAHPLGKC